MSLWPCCHLRPREASATVSCIGACPTFSHDWCSMCSPCSIGATSVEYSVAHLACAALTVSGAAGADHQIGEAVTLASSVFQELHSTIAIDLPRRVTVRHQIDKAPCHAPPQLFLLAAVTATGSDCPQHGPSQACRPSECSKMGLLPPAPLEGFGAGVVELRTIHHAEGKLPAN